MELTELIALSVKHNASDLHLCCGDLPRWRNHGMIQIIPGAQVTEAEWFTRFIQQWLSEGLAQRLQRDGQCDFAFTSKQGVRIRASLFTQQRGLSLALRLINSEMRSFDELGLPSQLTTLMAEAQGLLLIAGATGSGKSTSLAALLDYVNHHWSRHVITLEDPIEFCHRNHNALIQQREIGEHLTDFESGIRAALRQDPDIIVIGELRDKAAIQLALTAAETGHLVLATLHSADSARALQRLADAFPIRERESVRAQLAQALSAILSQQLRYTDTEVVALFELLINNNAVANLIREGRNHQLPGHIELASQEGMLSFRQSQLQRIAEGRLGARSFD